MSASAPRWNRSDAPPADRRKGARLRGILLGVVAGLAWAAALRAYMWQIGTDHEVTWAGTFFGILLAGAVAGGLLGWADARRRDGTMRGHRWFALAPFAFALTTLSLPGQLQALISTGLGGGALGVPVIAVLGGFALGHVGAKWLRAVAAALALAGIAGLISTVPIVGGDALSLSTPRGLWVGILIGALMVLASAAASVPFAAPVDPR